jgi:hypothetical protein
MNLLTLQRQLISFIPNMGSLEIPIYNILAAKFLSYVVGLTITEM